MSLVRAVSQRFGTAGQVELKGTACLSMQRITGRGFGQNCFWQIALNINHGPSAPSCSPSKIVSICFPPSP